MSRSFLAALLVVVAAACVGTLVTGAAIVDALLPGGLPVGNALAWLALVAFSASALLLSARGSLVRMLAWASLVLSVAWFPVSALLAGNLALNFSGEAGGYWLAGSVGLLGLVVGVLLLAAGVAVLGRLRRPRAA